MMNQPPLTFRELLRLSYSGPLTWLCAEHNADTRVKWVALDMNELTLGDVLMISGDALTPTVAKKSRKMGGVAIILLGTAPQPDAAFPDDLPIVSIDNQADARQLYRNMLTILINQRAYLMERGVRIHAQLSQLAAEGEGLISLAQAIYELSGRGVLVQDKRLGLLAEHASSTLMYIWDEVREQLLEKEHLPLEMHDRKKAGKQTTLKRQPLPGELERIITPISVGGVARGYLSLVDVSGMLDTLDFLVAEQGALVCAVEMARTKAVRETEKRLKGNLLTALLEENITPRDANLWVQNMGLDLEKSHIALRFAWDPPLKADVPSMRRLETLVNGEATQQKYPAIIETIGAEVVCIFELTPVSGRPKGVFEFSAAILARAQDEYPDIPARCGVGILAAEMRAWRTSFRQAGQALEMARRLREEKPLYYPDLSVYRLLLQLEHHPELMSFKTIVLGPLLDHEGGKELLRTLEAYFDHNGNLSQAAEALFIHRNTLTYRMDRIAEISGMDLDNTETRLAVQLALRINRMTVAE
jgi:PucR family transcriptional regulator, purine catabolism regulatory protein